MGKTLTGVISPVASTVPYATINLAICVPSSTLSTTKTISSMAFPAIFQFLLVIYFIAIHAIFLSFVRQTWWLPFYVPGTILVANKTDIHLNMVMF